MKVPVFMDIDGTLLNDSHALTERTRQALLLLREKGYVAVLASGRCRDGMKCVLENLPYNPWTIMLNGAFVMDGEKNVIYEDSFPYDVLSDIVDIADGQESPMLYFYGEHWGSSCSLPANQCEEDITGTRGINVYLKDLARTEKVHKILVHDSYEKCQRFLEKAGSLHPELEMEMSSPNYVEVNTHGISKGSAVRKVCAVLGVDPRDAVCFGDYYNDLTMFDTAGESVAMGNAVPEIKAKAKYVTLSNEEDGLADWIEKNL